MISSDTTYLQALQVPLTLMHLILGKEKKKRQVHFDRVEILFRVS
jgi:hypothetical protein